MESFFCEFGRSIQVDPKQSKNGGYYGNCLQLLGINVDIAVRPRQLMDVVLGGMSLQDQMSVKLRVAPLFFLEANLAVFSATTEQPSFFDGIEDFVALFATGIGKTTGCEDEITRKKGIHENDNHAVESKTYAWLLEAALALVWNEYRQLGLELREDSFLVDEHIIRKSIKSAASETDLGTLFNTYKALFPTLEKRIKFLDSNLYNFSRNSSDPGRCMLMQIKGPYRETLGKQLNVSFNEAPFNYLFHKVKKKNSLNFKTPSKDFFTFYPGHNPPYSLLFKTLLLLDLNEGLTQVSKNMAMNHSTYYRQKIEQIMNQEIKQPDRLAKQLRTEFRRVDDSSRFAVAGERYSAHEEKVGADYVVVNRSRWREPEGNSLFAVWQAELTVEEAVIEHYTGDRMILNIAAFYFNGDSKAQITCELIGDYDEDNKAVFCIGLDKFRIDELGFRPDGAGCVAGFAGEPGEGWLVVVFEAE